MVTFQWGRVKNMSIDDKGPVPVQVIICLDCFDWETNEPQDCRLWMVTHTEREHPSKDYMKNEISIFSSDDKRYD